MSSCLGVKVVQRKLTVERVARAATVTLAPVACLLAPVSGSVRVGGCLSAEVGLTLARGLGLDRTVGALHTTGRRSPHEPLQRLFGAALRHESQIALNRIGDCFVL